MKFRGKELDSCFQASNQRFNPFDTLCRDKLTSDPLILNLRNSSTVSYIKPQQNSVQELVHE